MLYFGIMIFWLAGKVCIMKIGKGIAFPESRYVNSKPVYLYLLCTVFFFYIFLMWRRNKPTYLSNPHLHQRLPFNKEETRVHVFSMKSVKPSRTSCLRSTSSGCFHSNIYTKNDRTANWIGKTIIYLIMWIYVAFMFFVYCSHHIYIKDFYQVLFVAYFSGFLPVSASIFNFKDCLKCISIIFL